MATISKDTLIGDLIRLDQGTIPILMEHGMHCVGCPSSAGESLEEACLVHGLEVTSLVTKLNEYLASK